MTEVEQEEWWGHWLKPYWENRLQGVPAVLESGEVEHMLDWLTHLGAVFPEAVNLAVQMPPVPLQHSWVISELVVSQENGLLVSYPEAIAKLLAYLWKCNLSRSHWDSSHRPIDSLLQSGISSELKKELEDIKIQL